MKEANNVIRERRVKKNQHRNLIRPFHEKTYAQVGVALNGVVDNFLSGLAGRLFF